MPPRTCRNRPRFIRTPSDFSERGTPTPSDVRPQDAPLPDPPVDPAPAPTSAKYPTKDLQAMTKVYMDSFLWAQASRPESQQEGQLKARFPDFYYGKSHMECYHFCQQCEDLFATAGAIGPNHTLFAASFLRNKVSFRWHQHLLRRNQVQGDETPLSWPEFKTFFQKSLRDSKSFVETIWSRIRWDS